MLLALLLGAYAWRTVDRNFDWEDEERLFRAALKVLILFFLPGTPNEA